MNRMDEILHLSAEIDLALLKARTSMNPRYIQEARNRIRKISKIALEQNCMDIADNLHKQDEIERLLSDRRELGVVTKKGFIVPAKLQRK